MDFGPHFISRSEMTTFAQGESLRAGKGALPGNIALLAIGRQLESHESRPREGQMQVRLAASHFGFEGPLRTMLARAEEEGSRWRHGRCITCRVGRATRDPPRI